MQLYVNLKHIFLFLSVGAVDKSRRKVSPFHYPWMFKDNEIQVHCRMSKIQFFDFADKSRNASLRQRDLNIYAQAFMMKKKLSHNTSFDELASYFSVSKSSARAIYIRLIMYHFQHTNTIPNLVKPDGTVNVEERTKLYRFANSDTPDYFKRLIQDFEDPSGRNRTPVLLNIDATYYYTQGSGDLVQFKELFCSFKCHHIVKMLNVTDMKGKFLAVLPLATSSSPASGDHHLVQRFSHIEDNYSHQVNYLRTLLEGTDTHFCVLVVDAGFVTDLRNKPREVQNVPTLSDICNDAGATLLHTSESNEGYILTRNSQNNIIKDDADDPEITAVENRIKMTRIFRIAQEQIHSTLKRQNALLNSKFIPNSYLSPLTPSQLTRFNLPETYKDIPFLAFVSTVCCSLVNLYHPGYDVLYISRADQVPAAERMLTRLFTVNPLLHNIWPPDSCFDSATGGNWINSTFGLFYGLNLFPRLESHQVNPVAVDLVSGPHALMKAQSLLTYMGQLTIDKLDLNLTRLETQQYLQQLPQDWRVQYFHIKTPDNFVPTTATPRWVPDFYDENQFGPWNDMTFVRARIPPSHKSATSISNYHYAVIGFGQQSSDHLRLLPPFDKIYMWKCFRCPSKNGSLSMCRHLAALLLPISFPQEYKSTYKPVNLFSATGPEARQAMRVLPPVTESQPIPLNIPRRSSDTRQNIIFYDLSSSPRGQPSSTTTSSSGQAAASSTTTPAAQPPAVTPTPVQPPVPVPTTPTPSQPTPAIPSPTQQPTSPPLPARPQPSHVSAITTTLAPSLLRAPSCSAPPPPSLPSTTTVTSSNQGKYFLSIKLYCDVSSKHV